MMMIFLDNRFCDCWIDEGTLFGHHQKSFKIVDGTKTKIKITKNKNEDYYQKKM